MARNSTKTLTIKDEVYKKLSAIKRADESFSDLFERLAYYSGPVEILKRLRGTVEFEDKERVIKEIHKRREERVA